MTVRYSPMALTSKYYNLYSAANNTESPPINLQSSQGGKPVLHYQDTKVGPDAIELGVLFTPEPTSPCATQSNYSVRVDVCPQEAVSDMESPMRSIGTTRINDNVYEIDSRVIGRNYIRIISVLDDGQVVCASSYYLYSLLSNGQFKLCYSYIAIHRLLCYNYYAFRNCYRCTWIFSDL